MKTRFSHRLGLNDMFPDQAFGAAVIAWKGFEARVIWLWLPIWSYEYDWPTDSYKWGQRILIYNGRTGFSLRWRFR